MKKMLIGLLMLAVATGAFAQVTVSGDVQLDLGTVAPVGDSDIYGEAAWKWDFLDNGGTLIQANAKFDKVKAWLRIRSDWKFMGNVSVDLDPATLSIGYNRLPVAFWSSYELFADNHFGIGASATARATYIQAEISGLFFGVADPDVLNGKSFKSVWSPVFYLGYNYTSEDESISAGGSFVGVHNADAFSFMGNLHGRFGFDPLSVGLNVSLYGAPEHGPFTLTEGVWAGGKDGMAMEALLDIGVGLPICNIGFGAGFVVDLTNKDKGGDGVIGMKFGLSANFEVGDTGFHIVPGVGFTTFNKDVIVDHDKLTIAKDTLEAGISLMYSF